MILLSVFALSMSMYMMMRMMNPAWVRVDAAAKRRR